MDCHKQFTNISSLLGELLDNSLKDIERFFYSSFWLNRFKRRMDEEDEDYIPIQLDITLGVSSDLRDRIKFKISNEGTESESVLVLDPTKDDISESNINNTVLYKFGHKQYKEKAFHLAIALNKRVIGSPGLFLQNNEILNREEYKHLIDPCELRQNIILVVKEMHDKGWTLVETYDKSKNLDIIRNIFTRDYILKLIDNIL